jgi:2-polyprenyl-3-methyl-5-hydroxy-6-metoxy-1,4-benzoquinol methylase
LHRAFIKRNCALSRHAGIGQLIREVNQQTFIHRQCPVCQQDEPQPFWSKGEVSIVRCARCSMLYTDPARVEFVSGQFYDQSTYHLFPDKITSDYSSVRFERELRIFRQFCGRGVVLDVGCSTGAFLVALQSRFPGNYQVAGTDVAGPALDYADKMGIPVIKHPFSEHDFGTRRFDAITFWAVMEHLANPAEFLRKAADILSPGGHCFILVPNMRSLAVRLLGPRYRYVMPEHLNYFTDHSLRLFTQTEPRFVTRALHNTHFNPLVIWQDWSSRGAPPSESHRAGLLKKTTALKQRRGLRPVKVLYQGAEGLLGALGLADNLLLVLERIS